MSILHFRKQLAVPPVTIEAPGICVRTIVVPDDIGPWLALRAGATARLAPVARPWSVDDFRREMLNKPWWRGDHTWVAITGDLRVASVLQQGEAAGEPRSPPIVQNDSNATVGAVTLGFREGAEASVPVVHWLLVEPAWQRRGIARVLLSYLETAAWDAGHREVELETHANWHAAVAFYQSIGYAPRRERSSR